MENELNPRSSKPTADQQFRAESWALWLGLSCMVAGLVVCIIGFSGYRPDLAGYRSVGVYAAIMAAISATVGAALGYRRFLMVSQIWLLEFPRYRQIINAAALVLIHAAICAMAGIIIFRVFQDAFLGLNVDRFAGSLMVGVYAGICGYAALVSAARISAQSLSALLAIFLVTGVFISMLAAEDPYWWQSMFSELGTRASGTTSFWTFNLTLVISGVVLSTLTAFIVRNVKLMAGIHDDYAEAQGKSRPRFIRPRPAVVRICLLGLGLCVIGIGLVPISVAAPIHAGIVRTAAGFIVVLLVGAAFWLPGFPWVFHLFSFACFLGLVGAALLWQPLAYYNLTAFELAVVGIVFGWLVVFIRTTAAALAVKEKALEDLLLANQQRLAAD
ncbi:hypothetical protein [Paeniglutamicibacter gangotriensis]|uniref:Uncharacterized protein n=1 Tax=Paeniglutamicibacter gangotriensis Lz1y TaxID=1276920 RepID=M7MZY4_9MICC|nr:hypothetical protein [Paeniglutamicibacter gangotriensis]EMR00521.1 hypothetical protein ADIAG_00528 [Paeniglutamicibacter gangotriensis Lz1y]